MAVAPDDDVLRLAQLLAGDDEARQSAYAELETADAAVAAAPAVVNALRDSVCSTQVEGTEFRQIGLLVLDLMLREGSTAFRSEYLREEGWARGWWEAPVLLTVTSKPAAHMTRDDMLTIAVDSVTVAIVCQGFSASFEAAGEDEMAMIAKMADHPLGPSLAENPGANERLIELGLEICREPQGLGDRHLACLWVCVCWLIQARPEMGAVAANGGVFEIAAAELRESLT